MPNSTQQQFDLSTFRKEVEERRNFASSQASMASVRGHDEDHIAYQAEVNCLEGVLALLPGEEDR